MSNSITVEIVKNEVTVDTQKNEITVNITHGDIVMAQATPITVGTTAAAIGTSLKSAREDHRHAINNQEIYTLLDPRYLQSYSESDPVWEEEKSNYYSKTQTDSLLTGKSDTNHNHSLANLTEKSYDSLDDKPDLTSLHTHSNKSELDLVTDGNHDVRTDNPHSVTKTQIGLSNVTNDSQVKRSEMGEESGVATLGADGKIPSAQLPALAISDTFVVASEAAMLALTVEVGDIAIRTDESKTYILQTEPGSVLANWKEILTPPSPVQSVNGKTGNISLTTTDITEGNNQYYTDARARAAISAGSPLGYNSETGALSIQQANTDQSGYLSNTDWNTFNNKQSALGYSPVNKEGDTMTGTLQVVGLITPKIYPTADAVTAIQIAKANGTTIIGNIDTTNSRLGWGTLAPASELHIASNLATSPRGIMSSQHNDGTDGARLHLRKSRGTNAIPAVIVSGDMLGRLVASGYDGSAYLEMGAIEIASSGTIGANRVPTRMAFLVATDASPSVLTERMCILPNGNVGIGTTAPGQKLDVSGNIRSTGDLYLNGTDVFGGNSMSVNIGASANLIGFKDSSGYNRLTIGTSQSSYPKIYGYSNAGAATLLQIATGLYVTGDTAYFESNTEHRGAINLRDSPTDYIYSSGSTRVRIADSLSADGSLKVGANADPSYTLDVAGTIYNNNAAYLAIGSGNVGIGTTSPTNILSFGGNAARTVWLERHTTADTVGSSLTLQAGGATAAATNKAGGALILKPGVSTGTGESGVQIQGCIAGASGTADNTIATQIQVLGNKIGFYSVTPVVRPTALTTPDASAINSGDATTDTVIANMRTRINELETKLQNLGLLT